MFNMIFYTKISDYGIILYISKNKIKKYRYRHYFNMEVIRNDIHFIKVYFILDKFELYVNEKDIRVIRTIMDKLKIFFLIVKPKI